MKIVYFLKSIFLLKDLYRYYAAGMVINSVGYLAFLIFIYIGIDHKISATVLYIFGSLVSYLINRKYVFNSNSSINSSLSWFAISLLGGYFLNISLLYFFVDTHGFNPAIIQILSVFIISIYFYLINKFVVHRSF